MRLTIIAVCTIIAGISLGGCLSEGALRSPPQYSASLSVAVLDRSEKPIVNAMVAAIRRRDGAKFIARTNHMGEVDFGVEDVELHWIEHPDFRPVGPFFGGMVGCFRVGLDKPIRVKIQVPQCLLAAIAPFLDVKPVERVDPRFPPELEMAACVSFVDVRAGLRWSRAGIEQYNDWVLSEGGPRNLSVGSGSPVMPPCIQLTGSDVAAEVALPADGVYAIVLTVGWRLPDSGINKLGIWPSRTEFVGGSECVVGVAAVQDARLNAGVSDIDHIQQVFAIALDEYHMRRVRDMCENFASEAMRGPPGWSIDRSKALGPLLQSESSSRPKAESRPRR